MRYALTVCLLSGFVAPARGQTEASVPLAKAPTQPIVVVVARTYEDGALLIEFHEPQQERRIRSKTVTDIELRDGRETPVQRQIEEFYWVQTPQWRSIILPHDQFRVYRVSGEVLSRPEIAEALGEPRPALYLKQGERLEAAHEQLLRADALMVVDRRRPEGDSPEQTPTEEPTAPPAEEPPALRVDRAIVFGAQAQLKVGDDVVAEVPAGAHIEVLQRNPSAIMTAWDGQRGWLDAQHLVTYREAFHALSQMLEDRPSVEDYRRRAELLWRNGDRRLYGAALEDYTNALRLDPSRADVYWERATLRCLMGDVEAAQTDYAIAKRLDIDQILPTMAEAYRNLAKAYTALGQRQEAAIWQEKARAAEQ